MNTSIIIVAKNIQLVLKILSPISHELTNTISIHQCQCFFIKAIWKSVFNTMSFANQITGEDLFLLFEIINVKILKINASVKQ